MAQYGRLVAGYCSETRRARFVRRLFAGQGIDPGKLAINDAQTPSRSSRSVVAIQEGAGEDLSADEFSAFMSLGHSLIRDHDDTRFATGEMRCILIEYDHVDSMSDSPTTPGEAGEQLADPEEIMSDESTDDETEEQTETDFSPDSPADHVIWCGGHRYLVWTGEWQEVDLHRDNVEAISPDALSRLAKVAPSGIETNERLTLAHIELVGQAVSMLNNVQANAGQLASPSGDGGSAADEDADLVQDVPSDYDDYDLSMLEGEIEEWLAKAEDFESDFDADIVEIDTGRVEGSVGFVFDTNPFSAGYHNGDEWEDQDGFNAARDAWKSITQGKDEIAYHGDPDYINFLPAAKVGDVV